MRKLIDEQENVEESAKMGCPVSLVRIRNSDETKKAVSTALSLIDFKLEKNVRTVVIKPNLCYYWTASSGCTTDPHLVTAIIDVIREMYGKDLDIKVVESDATAMKTIHAFQMLGYTKLAEEKKVQLFNLSQDVLVGKEVQVNGQKLSFKVPKLLLDADLFINVPKLKVMREVTITCALKNLFGCIGFSRKIIYHSNLHEAIVGINKVLKPHLTIVDGLVALGKFPVKLGLIMASTDSFSVDWTAAQIMGYNPSHIKYLKIAMLEKMGTPHGITILGEAIDDFKRIFPKVNAFRSKLSWDSQLNLLRIYNKIVHDTIPDELQRA